MAVWKKRTVQGALGALVSGGIVLAGVVPANADGNVIQDDTLRACINETIFNRTPTAPIAATELKTLIPDGSTTAAHSSLTCSGAKYYGIASFEGLQESAFKSIRIDRAESLDLTPLSNLPRLNSLTLQQPTVTNSVLDLSVLDGIGDTLRTLSITAPGTTPGAADMALDTILGLDTFPGLQSLTINSTGATHISGLSALTNMRDLRLGGNYLTDADLSQIPVTKLTNVYLQRNSANDFSWIPAAKVTYNAGAQFYLGDEWVLKSADSTTLIADPVDRAKGAGGAPALLADGTPDAGPIEMSDFRIAADLVPMFTKTEAPVEAENYAVYAWAIGTAPGSESAFPIVEVDLVDRNDLGVTTGTEFTVNPVEFTYDTDAGVTFSPVSFAVVAGELPSGVILDVATGELRGTVAAPGSHAFSLAATDALGNRVVGNYTLSATDLAGQHELAIKLSAPQIRQGDTLTIHGAGFANGEEVAAQVHSDPVDLAPQIADENGDVVFTFAAPRDFELGEHMVILNGATSGEIASSFTVVAGPTNNENAGDGGTDTEATGQDGPLAETGASTDALIAPAIGAVVLLLAGTIAVLWRRRTA